MQTTLDANPNRIENDIMFKDARREGCSATRGALNLGTSAPFGHYVHKEEKERSSWWLVAIGAALVVVSLKGLGLV